MINAERNILKRLKRHSEDKLRRKSYGVNDLDEIEKYAIENVLFKIHKPNVHYRTGAKEVYAYMYTILPLAGTP